MKTVKKYFVMETILLEMAFSNLLINKVNKVIKNE